MQRASWTDNNFQDMIEISEKMKSEINDDAIIKDIERNLNAILNEIDMKTSEDNLIIT